MANTRTNPAKLTEEQREELIETCFSIKPIFTTACKFGFTTKNGFQTYLRNNPEFWSVIKQARIDACDFIEEELLEIPDKYDSKMAKVALDMYCRVLAFRVPSKYSQRIDMNVNNNISIQHNIVSANDRLTSLLKDVAPVMIASAVSTHR